MSSCLAPNGANKAGITRTLPVIQLASQLLKPAEGVLSVNETLERLAQEMGLEINQNWQAALQLAA